MLTLRLALKVATQDMIDAVDLIDANFHKVEHVSVLSSMDSQLDPILPIALQVMPDAA
jgi:hypothetical protein